MVKLRHLLATLIIGSLVTLCAFAQSSLTQIRDTITNPDGSAFNGMVVITWNGFSVPSGTPVSELSASAQIYNGALSVLLVPTTTATAGTYYQVVYSSSNGTVTWTETWQVPPSTTPLTVSQVRQSTTEGSGSGSGTGSGSGSNSQYATLPISITQVTNLSSDLNSINSSIASLNTQIASIATTGTIATLQSTVNTLGATVSGLSSTVSGVSSTVNGLSSTVNGLSTTVGANTTSLNSLTSTVTSVSATVSGLSTSLTSLTSTVSGLTATVNSLTSGGGSTTNFVDQETPGGSVNGSNTGFTLANPPSPSTSLSVFRNGLLQSAGLDYSVSGAALTFLPVSIPQTGDIIQVSYRIPGTGASATFVDAASPAGVINGTNLVFTLGSAPTPASSLKLYKNGLLLLQNGDYSLNGSTITFSNTQTTPQNGDVLIASYRH